jgi:hypothetical protein
LLAAPIAQPSEKSFTIEIEVDPQPLSLAEEPIATILENYSDH